MRTGANVRREGISGEIMTGWRIPSKSSLKNSGVGSFTDNDGLVIGSSVQLRCK